MTNSAAAALSGAGTTPPATDAGTTPPTGASVPNATPPAGDAWYAGHPDENIRNWAANKGWADPNAALESGYNLEKLIGFEKAGRTIVLPKDDATPEERATFFQKLGVPEKADGYKVPESMANDPMITKFREMAHKSNMLPKQFEETVNWYQEQSKTARAEYDTAREAQGQQDITALKTEWGAAYEQNIEAGRRAAAEFLPAKDAAERQQMLDLIEGAVGTAAMLRFFTKVGAGLGEHRAVDNGEGGSFGNMMPAAAKAKIEALKQDREWSAAYLKGDAAKKAEMERLIKFAFPGDA